MTPTFALQKYHLQMKFSFSFFFFYFFRSFSHSLSLSVCSSHCNIFSNIFFKKSYSKIKKKPLKFTWNSNEKRSNLNYPWMWWLSWVFLSVSLCVRVLNSKLYVNFGRSYVMTWGSKLIFCCIMAASTNSVEQMYRFVLPIFDKSCTKCKSSMHVKMI